VALRRELVWEHVRVTPAEHGRHPRIVALGLVGTGPGFVVATATVDDGGIAVYRLRFTLWERAGRWLASDLREG
jgi:hypothetical protein